MKEKFSLLKAINDVANNRQLDERAQEVVTAGIAEMRKAVSLIADRLYFLSRKEVILKLL